MRVSQSTKEITREDKSKNEDTWKDQNGEIRDYAET
jgi:hypothetical protein